jgi:hypothetical protein
MQIDISFTSESAPYLVMPTDFGLNDTDYNIQTLKHLKRKHPIVVAKVTLGNDQTVNVSKTGDDNDGTLFIEYNGHLGWYAKFHTYKYKFLHVKAATQTKIWKHRELPVDYDFSPNLFYGIVLNLTGSVLSDIEHTEYGQDFWKRRLRESIKKGYSVALVDFGRRNCTVMLNHQQLESAIATSWLGDPRHANRYRQLRFLISKEQLIA